jgi:tRNA (Thr-GGU) A37 N-methylase
LETRVGNVLYVNGLDILDGTPVLDIKPFSSRLSEAFRSRDGWMEEVDPDEVKARGGRTPDRDPNQTQRTGEADDWKELETGGERPPSGNEE